jgi:hypothetical protein
MEDLPFVDWATADQHVGLLACRREKQRITVELHVWAHFGTPTDRSNDDIVVQHLGNLIPVVIST